MIYRTDLKCGPQPVPFGSLVTIEAGTIVVGDHRNMVGVAARPRWAVTERQYEPGRDVRVLTDGWCLTLVDGQNTSYRSVSKGKLE